MPSTKEKRSPLFIVDLTGLDLPDNELLDIEKAIQETVQLKIAQITKSTEVTTKGLGVVMGLRASH